MIRLISFGLFVWGCASGAWWLFVLSYVLWAMTGSTAAALFTIHHIHRNDGERRVRTEDDDYV